MPAKTTPTAASPNPDTRAKPTAASQTAASAVVTAAPPAGQPNLLGTYEGPPKAQGDNRQNSGGIPSTTPKRSSQTMTVVLAAGATGLYPIPGDNVRIIVSSGPLQVRPKDSPWIALWQGMSYKPAKKNAWASIEFMNPGAGPLIAVVFIGFGKIFDNRAIPNSEVQPAAIVTTIGSGSTIAVTDKSGTIITDPNGTKWYAISRFSVTISGDSNVTNWKLINGNNTADLAKASFIAGTAVPFSVPVISGNVGVNSTAGVTLCCEVYNAVPVVPLP